LYLQVQILLHWHEWQKEAVQIHEKRSLSFCYALQGWV
jgi:hypothetical protein